MNPITIGKIPIVNVEWGEVNAAWGQCALLLTTMANQLNFVFKTAEIIPMGSTSKLKALPGGSAQQLYWEGSYFGRSSFNTAMSLFLTCLQELGNYAESLDRASQLPYAVDKDKIGGLSIKYGREDAWTKALKFLLTNLKFMLAWVTKSDR
jgi:beclin 1